MSQSVGSRGQKQSLLASAATRAATKRLQESHPDEYKKLLEEERVSRGLPPEPIKDAMAALRKRVAELEQELRDKVGPA